MVLPLPRRGSSKVPIITSASGNIQKYLDEFCYRWNRMHLERQLTSHLITACVLHPGVTAKATSTLPPLAAAAWLLTQDSVKPGLCLCLDVPDLWPAGASTIDEVCPKCRNFWVDCLLEDYLNELLADQAQDCWKSPICNSLDIRARIKINPIR